MKIGIITPTADGGRWNNLAECVKSVAHATIAAGTEALHTIVCDGEENRVLARDLPLAIIANPRRANDAGATPRAIGAAYAIGQGCDALFFLDDDNTFDASHIVNAIGYARQGATVVTSSRWMVSAVTGERMYQDQESDGQSFADTNTIALFGPAVHLGTTWNWFRQPSGTDRIFWDRLLHSCRGSIAFTGAATVNYVTRWAASYNVTGEDGVPIWQPPDPAKFAATLPNGTRIAHVSRPVWDAVAKRWIPEVKP